MAKIDVSKINGYADLSIEQKLAALEAFEFEPEKVANNDYETLKKALSKANAEAAEYKKQLRSKQTEAEIAEAARAEETATMKAELEQLKKEKMISGYKANFLALGYNEKLADETAIALANGNTELVFTNQKTFLELHKKEVEAAALNKQPELTAGKPLTSKVLEQKEEEMLRRSMELPV